jgi:PPM family protein phosphatase
VADGMGGHAAGEVASLTAIRALDAAFEASDERTAASLESAAKAANRAVWEQARTNREMLGMGTTLVALAVVENDDGTSGLAVAHIGDSRLYLYRDKALSQVTVDHSLVQELIDEGQISQAQAAVHPQRHVLTRALGVEPAVDVDVILISPENNDRYLLCSDGLPREASDEQIAALLSRFPDPSEAAKELVELANSRGGSDNVTVVVVDVQSNEQSPDTLIIVPGPASSASPESSSPPSSSPQIADQPPADDGNGSEAAPPEASKAVASHSAPARNGSPRRLNFRVVGFVVALCLVIGAAIASVAWYARSSYFVGLAGGRIAIYQGRPGGVLWFKPTLSDRTSYSSGSVLSYNLQALKSGQLEPSLGQAHQYVSNLIAEKREAELADRPPPRGGPSTTAHVPTTVHLPPTSRPPVSTVRTSASTTPATPSTHTPPTHKPPASAHTTTTGHGASTAHTHTTAHVGTTTPTATTHTTSTHTPGTVHPATTTRTVPAAHPGTTKRPATTKPTPSTHAPTTSAPTGSGHATTTTVAKARASS